MWGILRGSGDRIKDCELYGHPYFYIDHGYFARGHYDGHYRVVFCDRHLQGPPRPSDGKRWEALGLEVTPLRTVVTLGTVTAYLPISRHVAAYLGIDADAFDKEAIACLGADGLSVYVAPKEEPGQWDGADLVAGFQSNALLEASLSGRWALELGRSPASFLPGGRDIVFPWLADNQWTLAEMRSGKCWQDLTQRYGALLEAA
jgi:hypothetical protein